MEVRTRFFLFLVGGLLATASVIATTAGIARSQPPVKSSDAAAADAHQQLTETIGVLAGLHLYQTYLNVGFVADGKAAGMGEGK